MKLHDECDILMSLLNKCEHVLYNQHADHCFATQYVGETLASRDKFNCYLLTAVRKHLFFLITCFNCNII